MPLCPQITNTPITVTQTADFTVSSVLPVVAASTTQVRAATSDAAAAQAAAAAAQAEATTAINTANTAITNAATANATAIAANTAAGVAQATANGKNKVTYSTSAPGSTANTVGDIWFQYGSTSPNVGRIIAQYMGDGGTSWTQTTVSGLVIANIDAGNITTGILTAAVGISNPSGNFSVNGATGQLICTGAIVTGNITATSGTFTGTVFASAGTFTGTITSNAATITGGSFTVGSAFQIASSGFLFASGAQIGPWYFGGGFISSNSDGTGNRWSASTGVLATTSMTISAASGVTGISLLNGANISTGGGNVTAGAGTISASTGTITTQTLTSTGTLNVSGTATMATVNATSVSSSGEVRATGNLIASNAAFIQDASTTTFASNARIDVGDGRLRRSTASSGRFKEQITDISVVADLNPSKLLDLPVRAFKFKADYLDATDERAGVLVPGFIAEEVAQFYPAAADISNGQIENWNERFLIPGLLALIQNQEKRITELEGA